MGKANSKPELGEANEDVQAGMVPGKTPCMPGKKTFDIAITGMTGAGKSSFVNALRGMERDDEVGAAMTDVIQCTMERTGYLHPACPEITIWDLPGIGTEEFKAEDYVENMDLHLYDLFIVVADDRFTEYDAQLVCQIQKMKKKFYYVRTKLDESIRCEKMKSNVSEEEILEKIRAYCFENLRKAGESSPRVFLISRWHLDKYDFQLLKKSLQDDVKKLNSAVPLGEKRKRDKKRIFQTVSKRLLKIDLQKLMAAMEGKSASDVAAEIHEELEALQNARLDIAITGRSGAGKSSLVNALRGMADNEKDSSETGVTETTREVKEYPHPTMPKVTIWDLPGIGTPEFTAENYLKQVNFSRYDFFLIVAAGRFTEHDTQLAREIQKMKKKFYYVSTKIDLNITCEKRKENFNEFEILEKVRNNCCENLAKTGETSPRVFLMSRWDLGLYDFPLLLQSLEDDLDDLKRHALILATPIFSKEIMEKKKAALDALIWKLAVVSLFFGAVPVPGLSFACDLAILVGALIHFCKVFGLDEDSLRRLAAQVGKPVEELKSAIKNTPVVAEINTKLVIGLLSKSAVCATLTVIELVCDFVPVLGSIVGGISSFFTTLFMLRSFLQDVLIDATNVWAVARSP
uniref:Interferon-inducible GTPase 5-like n=1 Tax=Pogona vitticeps TaxID=103695 RepID=A0ABM5ERV6_9SAUR